MKALRVGGVPEHFNLPWRLALEAGAFEAAGVPVRYTDYPGGTGAMAQALAEGELDLALMLTEGATLDILRGGDHRLVKVWVSSPLVWGIHVPAGSGIRGTAGLAGGRIAISRHGSGSHLIAVVDAQARGRDPESLEFVVVNDLEGARAALAEGRAEVFLWERHMTQPLVDAGEFRRVGERVVPWPAFVASVRTRVIGRRGEEVRSVLDIASRWARRLKRRAGAAQEISERYGLEKASARSWLETVHWPAGYRRPTSALARVHAALRSQGALDGRDPASLPDPWVSIQLGRITASIT